MRSNEIRHFEKICNPKIEPRHQMANKYSLKPQQRPGINKLNSAKKKKLHHIVFKVYLSQ